MLNRSTVRTPLVAGLVVAAVALALGRSQPDRAGHGEDAFNTRLVGKHDLQGRSAYQPLPVRQGELQIPHK